MLKKTGGGQLAPVRANTPARCGRVSTRNAMKEKEVGGQLAPTITPSTLGRFSIRGSLKAIKKAIKKGSTGSQSASVAMSTKLGRPQREPHPDAYYGHKRTAVMSARFIHDVFKCSPSFSPACIPDDTYPTLDKFIAYALSRSESDLDVHYYAMYLIWRMHIKDPELRAHHSHETYMAALMVATKLVTPENYASESWSEVGQSIYNLERLLENEKRLCAMVKWELEVDPMLVEMVQEQIEMKYDESSRYKATLMSPAMGSSEWSDECDDSGSSSSVFSAETPDTSPLPSDSDSCSSSDQMAVKECVWW
ncbi:hypothetical protein B0J17DRAFT_722292 [Rhizoctonia solani]|nr:hypothetical protein B0J17DRAFT_722292 [Rhizoctonia solani]